MCYACVKMVHVVGSRRVTRTCERQQTHPSRQTPCAAHPLQNDLFTLLPMVESSMDLATYKWGDPFKSNVLS